MESGARAGATYTSYPEPFDPDLTYNKASYTHEHRVRSYSYRGRKQRVSCQHQGSYAHSMTFGPRSGSPRASVPVSATWASHRIDREGRA